MIPNTSSLVSRPANSAPRTAFAAAVLLCFGVAQTSSAQELTISTDQPAYEVAQPITLTVNGPAGAPVTLVVGLDDGPTFVPGYGEFAIDFSRFFLLADLGVLPASGELVLTLPLACRFAPLQGIEIYLQAVAFVGGNPVLSNPWHFTESAGDCSDVCVGNIQQMGVQTTFTNVPTTGKLSLVVKRNNGQQNVYGTFDIDLDLATDATGVLDVPLQNADKSLTVSILEKSGTSLTVRYCVDATINGRNQKLQGGNTSFLASYAGAPKNQDIHTSCSQPLAVGSKFGDYTVTKLIFASP